MLKFDQSKIWADLEARLARTQNPRHRQLLETVIAHGRAEAALDVDGLMATLVPEPQYHFWIGGRDRGPKGYDGVRGVLRGVRRERRRRVRVSKGAHCCGR